MPELAVDAGLRLRARATTARAARTFSLACRLLPAEVRGDVYLLYLVFRTLDDLVDDGDPAAETRLVAVERWCTGDAATTEETVVLTDLATRHSLPRDALRDFCAGMRDDLAGWRPQTEDDLDRYCYRVAGTVGLVMAAVLGVDGDAGVASTAACRLGMAMQRTNILRDLDEDHAAGRRYVSAEAVARHGPPRPGQRSDLLREQIARADELYVEGLRGVGQLRRGRPAIRAAAGMYREILRELERDGLGEQPGRATVSTPRKARAALRATVLRR